MLQDQRQVVALSVLGQQLADGAQRATADPASAHLTPPAVRPPTTRRSMMANRMITGTVATRPAANRWPQSTEYSPMYWLIATVSGCWLVGSPRLSVSATRKSFPAGVEGRM